VAGHQHHPSADAQHRDGFEKAAHWVLSGSWIASYVVDHEN
jgi:hypothetical protein